MQARSLTCPNCGGRTRIPHGAQDAYCMHCGQPVRLSDAVLEEQNRARTFPPTTPLRLGMKARFRDAEYELTGRQVSREVSEGKTYQWEEFNLVSPEGHLLYLEFDEDKWKVSEPFVPETPLGPDQVRYFTPGVSVSLDGRGALVTDAGTSQTVHAEGEFPWLVTLGQTKGYLDAAGAAGFYSVEWTEDAVEFYRGQFLDERQVYSMFGLHDLLAGLARREQGLQSRRWFGWVLVAASVVALVLWIVALASSGSVVPNGTGSVQLGSVGDDGARFGPIALKSRGAVYRLDISGQMTEQSNWVAAVLEDEEEQELIPVDREMWDESGTDEDGRWHESDLSASTYFVLKQPGNYYVRLYAEPEPGQFASGTASFTLREKVVYPAYFGWFGLLAGIAGVLFIIASAPSQTKAMLQSLKESGDD